MRRAIAAEYPGDVVPLIEKWGVSFSLLTDNPRSVYQVSASTALGSIAGVQQSAFAPVTGVDHGMIVMAKNFAFDSMIYIPVRQFFANG